MRLAAALQRGSVRLECAQNAHELRQIQQLVRLDPIGQRVDTHAADAHRCPPQQRPCAVLAHDEQQPLAGNVLVAAGTLIAKQKTRIIFRPTTHGTRENRLQCIQLGQRALKILVTECGHLRQRTSQHANLSADGVDHIDNEIFSAASAGRAFGRITVQSGPMPLWLVDRRVGRGRCGRGVLLAHGDGADNTSAQQNTAHAFALPTNTQLCLFIEKPLENEFMECTVREINEM